MKNRLTFLLALLLSAAWIFGQGLGVPRNSNYPKNPDNSLAVSSGSGAVPTGGIILIDSGSCPSGFTEDDTLAGNYLLITKSSNADVGTTGGSNSYTPAGTNGAPALAMNSYTPAGTNGSTSFTPSGTVSAPSFTGTAQTFTVQGKATGSATDFTGPNPYTPAGTISQPTFSGTAGTVPAESFTGTPATLTGSVSAPAFTGSPATITPVFGKVIACKAN